MDRREQAERVRRLIAREPFGVDCRGGPDLALFCAAMTHDSILNEPGGKGLESYERLEWLGDAVVYLASSDRVFRECGEGEDVLTPRRSEAISNEGLAAAFAAWGLDGDVREAILTGNGVKPGDVTANMLGDVFEALIGAAYLAFGFDRAKGIAEKALYDRPSD
ncbi:MAG: hypothetical protein LBG62_07290 [Candidatus Methanoplasma sp.]|jgi:ribonuclease-3|nr:hypothetical protein [Candidatus Methanoplasma sp.]